MNQPEIRRVYRQFTPEERERWLKARAEVEAEMPEIAARSRILREAATEPNLSGAIRRTVHRSGLMLSQIAREAGLTETQIHEFLLGERTLRSDVLDGLVSALGFEFPEDRPAPTRPKTAQSVVAPVPPLESTPAAPTS
jgi:DNA-binding phage protein